MNLYHIPLKNGCELLMTGAPPEAGPLPAVFYFALSAKDSLTKDPYNQPAIHLSTLGLRIFSINLPFHTEEDDPVTALSSWAKELLTNPALISDFVALIQEAIQLLIADHLIIPGKIGVMGLSRGGLIAAHAAAVIEEIGYVLGFAPLTKLSYAKEFQNLPEASALDLERITEDLVKKPLRFYMGNSDTRVGTRHCFDFIEKLTHASLEQRIRSPQVELILFPSIGYQGHGTPPGIFREGAEWMGRCLNVL